MYKKGTGNDKQGKDAGNRMLCPYRNFSQAIMCYKDVQNSYRLFWKEKLLTENCSKVHPRNTIIFQIFNYFVGPNFYLVKVGSSAQCYFKLGVGFLEPNSAVLRQIERGSHQQLIVWSATSILSETWQSPKILKMNGRFQSKEVWVRLTLVEWILTLKEVASLLHNFLPWSFAVLTLLPCNT